MRLNNFAGASTIALVIVRCDKNKGFQPVRVI